MLGLQDFVTLKETVGIFDDTLTDDIIDRAESYGISEDPDSLVTTVELFDEDDNLIATIESDDYEMALGYLEAIFDLEYDDEDDDLSDVEAAMYSRYGHQGSDRSSTE